MFPVRNTSVKGASYSAAAGLQTGLGNIGENGAIKGGEWAGYGPYGECREELGLGGGYDVEKRECETEEAAHAC